MELLKAQNYAKKRQAKEEEARDLKMDMLAKVLNKERPLLITAQRYTEIMSALRLAEEFDFNLVLDGAAVIIDGVVVPEECL